MAAEGLTVELNQILAVQKLARIATAASAFNVLNAIGIKLQGYVAESFETKGRGKWPPLSWLTVATRPHGGSVPLQDTGRYRQSWVRESDGQSFVAIGSNLKVGSSIPLAAIHEYGTGIHGRGRGWYLIEVKTKKVLAAKLTNPIFFIASGQKSGTKANPGWIIFGKYVKSDGVPERPVLPTKYEAEQMAVDVVENVLKNAVDTGQ